jgi:hypothetical protein
MKMILDTEVEGCWTFESRLTSDPPRCRNCGAILEPVPDQGHFNSRYLNRKLHPADTLVCCPDGCSERDAEQAVNKFLNIKDWCTSESTSWKWVLDLKSIRDAWIDRNGEIYPCVRSGHTEIARYLNKNALSLEREGWIKIAGGGTIFYSELSKYPNPTNKQFNTLFDWCVATGQAHIYNEFKCPQYYTE